MAGDRVVGEQDDDGADHGDDEAVDVEPGDGRAADERGKETADKGADDAEDDVEQQALAGLVDDLAADEPGESAEDEPTNDGHDELLSGEIGLRKRGHRQRHDYALFRTMLHYIQVQDRNYQNGKLASYCVLERC